MDYYISDEYKILMDFKNDLDKIIKTQITEINNDKNININKKYDMCERLTLFFNRVNETNKLLNIEYNKHLKELKTLKYICDNIRNEYNNIKKYNIIKETEKKKEKIDKSDMNNILNEIDAIKENIINIKENNLYECSQFYKEIENYFDKIELRLKNIENDLFKPGFDLTKNKEELCFITNDLYNKNLIKPFGGIW